MSLPVQPKSGPINRAALTCGLLASAAWQLWPADYGSVVQTGAAALCAIGALPPGIRALALLLKDYLLRLRLVRTQEASSDHGTAREADCRLADHAQLRGSRLR